MHEPISAAHPIASKPSFQPGSNGNGKLPQVLPASEPPYEFRIKTFKTDSATLNAGWNALMEKEHKKEQELFEIELRLLELVRSGIRGYSLARKETPDLLEKLQKISKWLHGEERKTGFEGFLSSAQALSEEEAALISLSHFSSKFKVDLSSSPTVLKISATNILKGIALTESPAGPHIEFCSKEEDSPAAVAKAAGLVQQALNTNPFWGYRKFYGLLTMALKALDNTTNISGSLHPSDKRRKFL